MGYKDYLYGYCPYIDKNREIIIRVGVFNAVGRPTSYFVSENHCADAVECPYTKGHSGLCPLTNLYKP